MCSYRVSLTVGHESEVRGGGAPAGGRRYYGETHDWRLYVRGAGGEDISRYVSKIVFTLHRSYTYPKRVIHEPPYEIRESGYGSFEIPIYVYIKHSTNPRKIKFRYKLVFQNHKSLSGSQKFSHIFDDPPEPVRAYLIEGGAKIVETKFKKVPDEAKYTAQELNFGYKTSADEGRFENNYKTCPEDRSETTYKSAVAEDSYRIAGNNKRNSPDVLLVLNKARARKENISASKYPEDNVAELRHSKSKHKTRHREVFEDKHEMFSNMDPVPKVKSVSRVSEEQLKRKQYENVSVNSKRRRNVAPETTKYCNKEFVISQNFENNVKKHYDRIVDVINDTGKSDTKVRTSNIKSVVRNKRQQEPQEGEKLTKAIVVDGLLRACKFVEMSSGEIELVSDLYLSLCKQERRKRRLKLPSFSDPIYRPELPPSLRGLATVIDYSHFLR